MLLNFRFERVTKNTIRYQEEGAPPFAVGTLYVQQSALKSLTITLATSASLTTEGWPQRLKVEITPQT